MINILIVDWILSQNGKGVKGFTFNQIYKGVNELEKVSFKAVYLNVRKLQKENHLLVVSDCIPLKFRLNHEKYKT